MGLPAVNLYNNEPALAQVQTKMNALLAEGADDRLLPSILSRDQRHDLIEVSVRRCGYSHPPGMHRILQSLEQQEAY